jgi:lysophospholipase L1-like esterase
MPRRFRKLLQVLACCLAPATASAVPQPAPCDYTELNIPPNPGMLSKTESDAPRPDLSSDAAKKALSEYLALAATAHTHDPANLCYYRKANQTAHHIETVFMGDSITYIWGDAEPDFFTPNRANRGIDGQTSALMLIRFRADVISLHPRVVHILAGTNDLRRAVIELGATEDNLASMIDLAEAHDIAVILATIPPPDGLHPENPAIAPATKTLNQWIRATAVARHLPIADYERALEDKSGNFDPSLTFDGTHPNLQGFSIMRALLLPLLYKATEPHAAPH